MVDTAVSNLSMKLLIKIDNKGIFEMHDHLRDMGQTIAEKEKVGTRLWEAAHLNTVSDINFSRLRLKGGNPQRFKVLCRPGLRYLHLRNVTIEGMKEDTLAVLPPSLIWLRLEHCPIATGKKGPIEKIFEAVRKPRHSRFVGHHRQLKIMQLKDINSLFISSLFSFPNIEQLQHLNIEKSKSLETLPDSIGNLSGLLHLNLRGCRRLNSLPNTIGNLSKLQYLNLEWCYRLSNLPDTIGNLSQLQQLDLEGCDKLTNLPDTIGNLSQLQHFNLRGCYRLNNLPNTIGNLSQLQHLDLKWCYTLNNLPNTIGNLSRLLHLDLRGCRRLNNLHDTINNLPQLQYFLSNLCCKTSTCTRKRCGD
ncbi:hypothetical protein SUGI_1215500 [Cryptomeria japonica]|uniref:Disease resistance R13L4/SHOC-2-like LRR domain-containing protein n=1 Tax=Cryptomeria japonica TaxID=3369 RepID=A0AAD3NPF2_CRYJA|nr:hypothetical protein SUGI_1215500 [Cryptomeria japonica]